MTPPRRRHSMVNWSPTTKARFHDLMANRGKVLFAAFDLLWLNGTDLRDMPLQKRKGTLSKQIRKTARRTFYVDHIERHGKALYNEICARDMEGIVCKPAIGPYRTVSGKSTWIKVKIQTIRRPRPRRPIQRASVNFPLRGIFVQPSFAQREIASSYLSIASRCRLTRRSRSANGEQIVRLERQIIDDAVRIIRILCTATKRVEGNTPDLPSAMVS